MVSLDLSLLEWETTVRRFCATGDCHRVRTLVYEGHEMIQRVHEVSAPAISSIASKWDPIQPIYPFLSLASLPNKEERLR